MLEGANETAEEIIVAAVRLDLRLSPPNRPLMRDDMKDASEELDSSDDDHSDTDSELDSESSEPAKTSSKIVSRSPHDVLDEEEPEDVAVENKLDEAIIDAHNPKANLY